MGGKSRQWIAAFACGVGAFVTGAAYSWITPLMTLYVSPGSPVPMTTTDTSWLAASIEVSAILCTVPIGKMSDRWGRKYLMMAIGPLCLMSYIVIIATRSIVALYVARIIHGLALGFAYIIIPMYMAELAEPGDRGKIGGIFQPVYYAGYVYSTTLGAFVPYEYYNVAQLAPPAIFIAVIALMPDSPHYLIMRGYEQKALESLAWLRDKETDDVLKEFGVIADEVKKEKKNTGAIKDLFRTSSDRRSFFLVQAVCVVKYACGSVAIGVYMTQTVGEVIHGKLASEIATIVFMTLLIASSLVSSVISDNVGRRPLLLISVAASAVCSLIAAVVFFLDSNTSLDVGSFIWLAVISMSGIGVLSNIGLGPLAQTIQAEYFPSRTRAIGGSVTQLVAAVVAYINVRQYQLASDWAGVYLNYCIFAAVLITGFVIFYFLIPETKGQSLGQVQKSISQNV